MKFARGGTNREYIRADNEEGEQIPRNVSIECVVFWHFETNFRFKYLP